MNILRKLLAFFAKRILKRYKPKVVGITGSIGKTSSKEAAFIVLKKKFRVRRNIKNYNNEFGVPLTIIGAESGGKSIWGWFNVFAKAGKLWLGSKDKKYPDVLILEMGADKPGDIKYLINIAPPDIAVVTKVSPVHIESFGTIDKITKEKGDLVRYLPPTSAAILNFDDDKVREMSKITKAKILSYGYSEDCDMSVIGAAVSSENNKARGLSFKLSYQGSAIPMFLPGVIGKHQLYAALAGAAAGAVMGMNMVDIGQALKKFSSPRGRMNIIEGINASTIIDDSYNSSPDAAMAALEAVGKVPREGRLLAALGDMLELGELADEAHQNLGIKAAKLGYKKIYAVGKHNKQILKGAMRGGVSLENIKLFGNSADAAKYIANEIESDDVILIKGSQATRMEKVVKAIMAHPERAPQLLIRQNKEWLVS